MFEVHDFFKIQDDRVVNNVFFGDRRSMKNMENSKRTGTDGRSSKDLGPAFNRDSLISGRNGALLAGLGLFAVSAALRSICLICSSSGIPLVSEAFF